MQKKIHKKKYQIHQQKGIKIIKQGKCKIRSVSLPNSKLVSLHTGHMPLKNQTIIRSTQLEKPQFWGCLVSDHFRKMQKKTLKRFERSKTQQKNTKKDQQVQAKESQKSTFLLQQYLKRKKQLIQIQDKQTSSQNNNKLFKNYKSNKIFNPIISEARSTLSLVQKYYDSEQRQQKIKRQEEAANKIWQLNQLIKWRSKVILKIQDELNSINNAKLWGF